MTRALVLRAPGINCDRETAQACRLVGFDTKLMHINELLKAPDTLLDYHFLVIPGGFSYGDDLGAGALLAKNLTIHLGDQLRRFIEEGRPVLGICNGFQVLVRAGFLPGSEHGQPDTQDIDVPRLSHQEATLTENASAIFECRWITLTAQPGNCIFTRGIDRAIELPVAHGEGQFVFNGEVEQLQTRRQVPLVYGTSSGDTQDIGYPANPNGSRGNIAGVCNQRGNVFGLMPHPERYVNALQHPQRRAMVDGHGDGILIFKNAFDYALQFAHETTSRTSTTAAPESKRDDVAHGSTYAESGVDIAAGEQAVRLMQKAMHATHGPDVLAGIGAFAGVFNASGLQKMRQPALVASTDGVGTKTLLAAQSGRYSSIGHDIVNHCVNDLLMQGGKPLFFMDYLATGKLDPVQAATIVQGVAEACQAAGCALLGGETAEMPDVYLPGAFDLAGTIVGVVEQDTIVNGANIEPGDIILGLPSNGLHTNGYSLARRVFAPYDPDTVFPELGEPLMDVLLRPHRSYLHEIMQLRDYLADRGRFIKGMAHITGGGFAGNISRILPTGTQAVIETGSWQMPPLFKLLARLGTVPRDEQYRALNMGIGMVVVLSPKVALDARCILPELLTIGSIHEGSGVLLQ
ncbi:MAG TPA: phosphoribosylformylglycinamidine cyclo-ligase [Ktedonobacteraceae bacterium]|jgi:phosphoribosylformylglycinamidine synthase I|nr:phosphoribosylformylglycinamidine cyclo-ligase [Ktedonobacteraceae bacterium]